MDLVALYRYRFPPATQKSRQEMWDVLCEIVFQQYIGPRDTVMDIGGGYGEFLHAIACGKKIMVDPNANRRLLAADRIVVLPIVAQRIPARYNNTMQCVFASNVLEHMQTKDDVFAVIAKSYAVLVPGGKMIIMGPNIDLVGNRYWDFLDHRVAVNGKSMCEGVAAAGFIINTYVKRFLPYTTKGLLPTNPLFLRWYLSIPPAFRPFAGQSLIVAHKPR